MSAWHGVAYTELATLAGTERAGTALGMANTAVYRRLLRDAARHSARARAGFVAGRLAGRGRVRVVGVAVVSEARATLNWPSEKSTTERILILIGQFDSPFVRRVAIALNLYGMAYEHRPWSVFGDADKIAPFNPLIRVPTLVLDSGDVLSKAR